MSLSVRLLPKFTPRAPRASLVIDTSMVLPDERVVEVEIHNISTGGFMGETLADLEPGTSFGVAIPRCGILNGTVRWTRAGEIGGVFRRPLNMTPLEALPTGLVERCGFAEVWVRRRLL